MNSPDGVSRRGLLAKAGLAFNAAAGAILAVPIILSLIHI